MTKNIEFSNNVAKYLQLRQTLKDTQIEMKETRKAIKYYLESEDLAETSTDEGQYTVKLIEITREMVATSDKVVSVTTTNMGKYLDKMVKMIIPEKFLDIMIIPKTKLN